MLKEENKLFTIGQFANLHEIKLFMEHRTIDSFDSLLKEKITELSRTITHLKSIQKVLSNHQRNIEMLRSLDVSAISLVQKESCYLVPVDVRADTSFEKEVEDFICSPPELIFVLSAKEAGIKFLTNIKKSLIMRINKDFPYTALPMKQVSMNLSLIAWMSILHKLRYL